MAWSAEGTKLDHGRKTVSTLGTILNLIGFGVQTIEMNHSSNPKRDTSPAAGDVELGQVVVMVHEGVLLDLSPTNGNLSP